MPPSTAHRGHLSRGWIAALLLSLGSAASAQPLLCGTFKDADSGARLTVESPVQGSRLIPGAAPEPYNLEQLQDVLMLANLATGDIEALQIIDEGHALAGEERYYTLESTAVCQASPVFAAGSCRADIASCMDDMAVAGTERWRQWCREGVPAGCNRLIEDYRSDARNALVLDIALASNREEPAEPAACQRGSTDVDAEACRQAEAVGRVRDAAWAFSVARSIPRDVPLPAAQLDEVSMLCREHPSASSCHAAAVALWASARLLPARDALQLACSIGRDPQACSSVAPLAALSSADLVIVDVAKLPCGRYAAQGHALVFGDDAQVQVDASGRQPAVMRAGAIRVRNEEGEDHVFWQLANGDLVGNDRWARFARYQRDGSSPTCGARASAGTALR